MSKNTRVLMTTKRELTSRSPELQEFLEAVFFKINEGAAPMWDSYGKNAWTLIAGTYEDTGYVNSSDHGWSAQITFDMINGVIYEIDAITYDPLANVPPRLSNIGTVLPSAWIWRNPSFAKSLEREAHHRDMQEALFVAFDDVPYNLESSKEKVLDWVKLLAIRDWS